MIEVRDTEAYGKGVFATENITKCKKLIILNAFCILNLLGSKFGHVKSVVNVLDDFAIKDHCANCLKDFEKLTSCPICSIMKYCSNDCMV